MARARTAARRAWPWLIQVLFEPGSPSAWRWRSPQERWAARAALGMATLALCVVNVSTVHAMAGLHELPLATPAPVTQLAPNLAQRALAVAVVAPLPLAAWRPMLAWRVGWLALLLTPLVPAVWWGGWPWGPPQLLALTGAVFLAGVRLPRPALWWMWALSLIPWWLWLAADVPNLNGPVSATAAFTAVVIAASSVESGLSAQHALAAQTKRAEAEQAQRAALEERTRIARELHDIVAHHMSLMAVRAETAPYRLGDLPEPARVEFSSLSELAREALADMRRLLGVLRHDQPAALAPQPQLTDLPALVDTARRAGATVELSAPSALDQVPSGVGVCAYRIVQESLSNASQHAPGAPITVSVRQDSSAILLHVANGPSGPGNGTPGSASPGGRPPGTPEYQPGHGLTGMRERVAMLGGSLSAGPAPGGGFVVSAVLPLRPTS